MTSRHRSIGISLLACCALVGCGANAEKGEKPAPSLQVGQENVVAVKRDTIVVGPTISGELQPENEATVRAETGGSVLEAAVEEGQSVSRGALLARIEAVALRQAEQSATTAVRSAESQVAVAQREAERTQQLVAAGALAPRDLDQARAASSQAEAQLAGAQSQLASARNQLQKTVVRSPMNGVVSNRAVNRGDVVSPGTALFTIIDPQSMRLDASVPSSAVGVLRVGADVRFTIRGYDEAFTGRVERISPAADPATRQVPIFVSIPNAAGRLVAGLFAEGRVVDRQADGLVVPANAVNTSDATPWVLRLANGTAERREVRLGLRDPQTERVQIASGVSDGDLLLRGPAQAITPGTSVSVPGASQPSAGNKER